MFLEQEYGLDLAASDDPAPPGKECNLPPLKDTKQIGVHFFFHMRDILPDTMEVLTPFFVKCTRPP